MVAFGLCRQKRHDFTAIELKVIRGHPWSSELAGGDHCWSVIGVMGVLFLPLAI